MNNIKDYFLPDVRDVLDQFYHKILQDKNSAKHGKIIAINNELECNVQLYNQSTSTDNQRTLTHIVKKAIILRTHNSIAGLKIPYSVGDDVIVQFLDGDISYWYETRGLQPTKIIANNFDEGVIIGHIFDKNNVGEYDNDSVKMFYDQSSCILTSMLLALKSSMITISGSEASIEIDDKVSIKNTTTNQKDILNNVLTATRDALNKLNNLVSGSLTENISAIEEEINNLNNLMK